MPSLRVPPYDITAEQAVLGSCLIDYSVAQKVSLLIKPSDFYREEHSIIFSAVQTLVKEETPVDIISVKNQLTKDQLKNIGGVTYLAHLADSVPNSANGPYYAKIVKDSSVRRQIIKIGGQISELGFEDEKSEVLLHQAKTLLDISNDSKILSTAERMMDILQAIDKRPPSLTIPFKKLDMVKFHNYKMILKK